MPDLAFFPKYFRSRLLRNRRSELTQPPEPMKIELNPENSAAVAKRCIGWAYPAEFLAKCTGFY
jgi:hypothetical protein